jgi:photosystem I reaction center subunit VIII
LTIIINIIIKKKNEKMIAPYFPAIFVPIIGIFLPGLAMAALFVYIEKESVE